MMLAERKLSTMINNIIEKLADGVYNVTNIKNKINVDTSNFANTKNKVVEAYSSIYNNKMSVNRLSPVFNSSIVVDYLRFLGNQGVTENDNDFTLCTKRRLSTLELLKYEKDFNGNLSCKHIIYSRIFRINTIDALIFNNEKFVKSDLLFNSILQGNNKNSIPLFHCTRNKESKKLELERTTSVVNNLFLKYQLECKEIADDLVLWANFNVLSPNAQLLSNTFKGLAKDGLLLDILVSGSVDKSTLLSNVMGSGYVVPNFSKLLKGGSEDFGLTLLGVSNTNDRLKPETAPVGTVDIATSNYIYRFRILGDSKGIEVLEDVGIRLFMHILTSSTYSNNNFQKKIATYLAILLHSQRDLFTFSGQNTEEAKYELSAPDEKDFIPSIREIDGEISKLMEASGYAIDSTLNYTLADKTIVEETVGNYDVSLMFDKALAANKGAVENILGEVETESNEVKFFTRPGKFSLLGEVDDTVEHNEDMFSRLQSIKTSIDSDSVGSINETACDSRGGELNTNE